MGAIPAAHLRGYRSYANLHKSVAVGCLRGSVDLHLLLRPIDRCGEGRADRLVDPNNPLTKPGNHPFEEVTFHLTARHNRQSNCDRPTRQRQSGRSIRRNGSSPAFGHKSARRLPFPTADFEPLRVLNLDSRGAERFGLLLRVRKRQVVNFDESSRALRGRVIRAPAGRADHQTRLESNRPALAR